jgi:hypothetical protein
MSETQTETTTTSAVHGTRLSARYEGAWYVLDATTSRVIGYVVHSEAWSAYSVDGPPCNDRLISDGHVTRKAAVTAVK